MPLDLPPPHTFGFSKRGSPSPYQVDALRRVSRIALHRLACSIRTDGTLDLAIRERLVRRADCIFQLASFRQDLHRYLALQILRNYCFRGTDLSGIPVRGQIVKIHGAPEFPIRAQTRIVSRSVLRVRLTGSRIVDTIDECREGMTSRCTKHLVEAVLRLRRIRVGFAEMLMRVRNTGRSRIR